MISYEFDECTYATRHLITRVKRAKCKYSLTNLRCQQVNRL